MATGFPARRFVVVAPPLSSGWSESCFRPLVFHHLAESAFDERRGRAWRWSGSMSRLDVSPCRATPKGHHPSSPAQHHIKTRSPCTRTRLWSPSNLAVSWGGAPLSIIKQCTDGQARPVQAPDCARRGAGWANPRAKPKACAGEVRSRCARSRRCHGLCGALPTDVNTDC
jgi:hypothetical protein